MLECVIITIFIVVVITVVIIVVVIVIVVTIIDIALCPLQAVHEMHSKGFCHADLKTSNAMVTHSHGQVVVKLIDMACSKHQKTGTVISRCDNCIGHQEECRYFNVPLLRSITVVKTVVRMQCLVPRSIVLTSRMSLY